MRKTAITALIATTVLLSACGGDDDATGDSTTAAEQGGGDATAGDDPADDEPDGELDLDAALLTADDLPEGAELVAIDTAQLAGGMETMAKLVEGATYDPAECQDNSSDPMRRDGVEAAAMTALVGTDVFMQAVYTDATADDIAAVEEYYERCGEVTFSGEVAGQDIEMTTTTRVVEAPTVDADQVIALDSTTAGGGQPGTANRIVYVVDGHDGMYVAANPDSTVFDLNALTAAALEKLRDARG